MNEAATPLITNDAVVLGLLAVLLAIVFTTSHSNHPGIKKFYRFVPPLLLCYFLPSVFTSLGIISGDISKLYFVSSRYLLPACLVLLCLSIDVQGIKRLGPKALIMFFTGTLGIIIGGPLALLIMSAIAPSTVGGVEPNEVWRGMTTVAGSWIGGGANQAAMKELFGAGDQVFSAMIAVDVIVANVWMAVLLFCAGESDVIDKKLKADNSAIKALQNKLEAFQASVTRTPKLVDTMTILGVAFGVGAVAHIIADFLGPWFGNGLPQILAGMFSADAAYYQQKIQWLSLNSKFLWLIVSATIIGVSLSFTKARKLEGVGASRVGSAFLYILVASIGMKMDIGAIFENPSYFLLGFIWILTHATLLIVVAKLIRAPIFFLAVGSQANVGGAASAPVVASAFHPTLAPVGVLLAVFGYAVGTFGAYLCGIIMRSIAG